MRSKGELDKKKRRKTMSNRADERREDGPADLEPARRVEAEHVPEAVVEAADAEDPGHGDALEEDDPQQHHLAAAEHVQQLEHVHAALDRPTTTTSTSSTTTPKETDSQFH